MDRTTKYVVWWTICIASDFWARNPGRGGSTNAFGCLSVCWQRCICPSPNHQPSRHFTWMSNLHAKNPTIFCPDLRRALLFESSNMPAEPLRLVWSLSHSEVNLTFIWWTSQIEPPGLRIHFKITLMNKSVSSHLHTILPVKILSILNGS